MAPAQKGQSRARSRSRKHAARRATLDAMAPEIAELNAAPLGAAAPLGDFTGRYIVLFDETNADPGLRRIESVTGLSISEASVGTSTMGDEAVVFDELSAGVMTMAPAQVHEVRVASLESRSGIIAMEPERILYALDDFSLGVVPSHVPSIAPDPRWSREYLRGYRAGMNALLDHLLGETPDHVTDVLQPSGPLTEDVFTWGLQATGVDKTKRTGREIPVAVLDTGLALAHPDFAGRTITSESFVAGATVDDRHGHGTHCIGTACGTMSPQHGPRYGVAPEAVIFAGRVMSDQGSGAEGDIMNGLNWAIKSGCVVVSLSLGSPVSPGQAFSTVFEGAARRALARGTLIVAAAGNNSSRPASVRPVTHPANCPSVMAVAAVNRLGQVSYFSNGGINPNGGGVDIAGPGEDVYSSYPSPPYRRLSGTSMATPHVAGVAALWAEQGGERGQALWKRVIAAAKKIPGASVADVGAGLVQAPQHVVS